MYGKFHAKSTSLKPQLFFSLKYVIDGHKKWPTPIFRFFGKISLAVIVEIVNLELRAVTDVFEIHTINCLIKKKIETNYIMFKVLFGEVQPEQKNTIIIIIKGSTGSRK